MSTYLDYVWRIVIHWMIVWIKYSYSKMSIVLLASQHLLYIVPHSIIKMDRLKRID